MIVHSVYFTLKPDAAPALRDAMPAALRALAAIPGVRNLRVGTPAPVPARPVLDTAYDFALILETDSPATLAAYQAHPEHQAFLQKFSPCWERVRVFDITTPDPAS